MQFIPRQIRTITTPGDMSLELGISKVRFLVERISSISDRHVWACN